MPRSPASRDEGRRGDVPRQSYSGVTAPGPRTREGRDPGGVLRLLIVDSDLASVLSVKEAAADLSVACDITHCLDIAAFMRTWRQMTPLPDLILVSRSLHSTRTEPLDDLEAELLHQPIPLLLWIQGTGPGIVETRRAGWPTMPKPATTADYQRFVTSLITNIPSRTQHPTTVPVPSPRHGHLAP